VERFIGDCVMERCGVERKSTSQAPRGPAKCRELARWLATPSGRSLSARRAQLTALGGPGKTSRGAGVACLCRLRRLAGWLLENDRRWRGAGRSRRQTDGVGFLRLRVGGPRASSLLQRRRGLTFFGVGAALATDSARWPIGELCWPADWPQGAPAQRASGRRANVAALAAHRTIPA
jgi:hypothetical protein